MEAFRQFRLQNGRFWDKCVVITTLSSSVALFTSFCWYYFLISILTVQNTILLTAANSLFSFSIFRSIIRPHRSEIFPRRWLQSCGYLNNFTFLIFSLNGACTSAPFKEKILNFKKRRRKEVISPRFTLSGTCDQRLITPSTGYMQCAFADANIIAYSISRKSIASGACR